MTIEILGEAEEDLLDGYQFYEQIDVGLGEYFLNTAFGEIESRHLYAGIHEMHFGYYRFLMHRFPFAVYYSHSEALVRIVAILDCRRSPDRKDFSKRFDHSRRITSQLHQTSHLPNRT